jgi:hypothetical protein
MCRTIRAYEGREKRKQIRVQVSVKASEEFVGLHFWIDKNKSLKQIRSQDEVIEDISTARYVFLWSVALPFQRLTQTLYCSSHFVFNC